MHDFNRAELIYEQTMEEVYDKVDKAIDYVQKLSGIVEDKLDGDSSDRAEELIGKILMLLEEM